MADDPEFYKVEVHRGDDQIPRDRYGRYLLPHPETGKSQAWTRVTTLAGALKDRYGLERWDWRNIVYGMGQRKALWAQAAAAKLTDTKTLDKIGDRAKEAADANSGADLGTAIHTFAERVDRGEVFDIPEPFDRDIRAYQMAMELAGISTALGWIERVICVPDLRVPESGVYGVCGTLDRVSNAMEWRLPRIGDIKSASDKVNAGKVTDPIITYGMQDIPLQLAMYSRGTHWWDINNEQWVEMPAIDQDVAELFHIPAGWGECRILEIDIAEGWKAVELALGIRGWQRRKDLYQTVLSVKADGEVTRPQDHPEGQGNGSASSGADVSHQGSPANGDVPTEGPRDPSGREPRRNGEGVTPTPDDPPAQPLPPPEPRGPIANEPAKARNRMAQMADAADQIMALYGDGDDAERAKQAWAQLSEMPHVDDPLAPADAERWTWAQGRVNDIKAHPDARVRLGQLWGVFDFIPLFPNPKNPDRTGPRNWGELSKLIGMLDLVEMEYQLPFPDSDPNPDEVIPSPAERRKEAEERYNEEQTAKRKASAAKARATRARNKAKETT